MTGIQPAALLDDPLLLAAGVEQAEAARWTDLHELGALQVELMHACVRQLVALNGGKPPDAFQVPRPGDPDPNKPIVMRPSDFGKMLAGGGG